jgi:ATP-dependent DNA helicase RecG
MIETISLILEDNRLILSNPGGLFGISVNELGQSLSRTRNSRLAEICQFVPAARGANVIEKLGSGIPKMYAEQDRYGFKRPRFLDGEIYFTSVLQKGEPTKNRSDIPSHNQNTTKILHVLSAGALTRAQIEQRTMLTTSQVRYALSKLMKEQQVSRIGKERDPNIVYMLTSDE